MEWAGKERFLNQKKNVEKNLGCCCLNKKIKHLNEKFQTFQALESFQKAIF
jgi:hypothetical protein